MHKLLGKVSDKKQLRTLVIIFACLIMTFLFSLTGNYRFDDYSDNYVFSMMVAGTCNDKTTTKQPWGLRSITIKQLPDSYANFYIIDIPDAKYTKEDLATKETRTQQIGTQGWFAWGMGRMESGFGNEHKIIANHIRILTALSFSLVVALISYQLATHYNPIFGLVFYLTILFSHWMADFSLSPYWCLFSWFFPMLGSLICLRHPKAGILSVILVFFAVALKCSFGYEYISTIMCSTMIFPFSEAIGSIKKNRSRALSLFKVSIGIGIAALAAFGVIISIHGYMMCHENFLDGIKEIYYNDILRRTHGNPDMFGPESESLQASTLEVLLLYIYTDTGFTTLLLMLFNIPVLYRNRKSKTVLMHICMILISLMGPVSWFVLAKGHSCVHVHLNPSLFLVGTIQVNLYVLLINSFQLLKTSKRLKHLKKLEPLFTEKNI